MIECCTHCAKSINKIKSNWWLVCEMGSVGHNIHFILFICIRLYASTFKRRNVLNLTTMWHHLVHMKPNTKNGTHTQIIGKKTSINSVRGKNGQLDLSKIFFGNNIFITVLLRNFVCVVLAFITVHTRHKSKCPSFSRNEFLLVARSIIFASFFAYNLREYY